MLSIKEIQQKKQVSPLSIRSLYEKKGISFDALQEQGKKISSQFVKNENLKRAEENAKRYSEEARKYENRANLWGAKPLAKEIIGSVYSPLAEAVTGLPRKIMGKEPLEKVSVFGQEFRTPSGAGKEAGQAFKKGEYQKGVGIMAGSALDVATLGWGGAVKAGVKLATKAGATGLKKAGIITGVAGTPIGAGYGFSGAMEQEGTAGQVLKSTLTGGALGFGLGAGAVVGAGVIGKGLGKLFSKKTKEVIEEIENEIQTKVPEDKQKIINEQIESGISPEEIVQVVKEQNRKNIIEAVTELNDPEKIAPLLKGKIAPEDIPTVSRLLKNVETEESANAILKKFDPDIQNQKLVEDIYFAETPEQVARFLKGKADDKTIKELSPILAEIRDEGDIKRMLDDFGVKAKSLEEKIDDVAKKVEEPKPKQTPQETPSFDEWAKGKGEQIYRSTHQVDTKTASPITKIDDGTLNSFVDEFKRQYGYPALKSKEVNKLKTIISNPEADVKIYRASPKNELNDGDWVTIDKNYANDIKRQNGGKVYEYTVKAEDLFYPKTVEGFKELPSLNKWGAFQYQSYKTRSQLKAEYDKLYPKETPKQTPKPEVKPKQTTFQALEGTGKLRERALTRRAREKAISDDIEGIKDIDPVLYKEMQTKKVVLPKAIQYVEDNFDDALAVVFEGKKPPDGLFPEIIYTALTKKAETDEILLRRLSNKNALAEEATDLGRRIQSLSLIDPSNPVNVLTKVKKEIIKNKGKAMRKQKDAINHELDKAFKISHAEKIFNDLIC